GMRHEECEDCRKKSESKHRCKGCACDQFRKLSTNTEVDLFLSGGTILEDLVFVNFDEKNCCAFFNSEREGGQLIVVDCQFVQAIGFESD
ncbi:hydrolase, partial [Bacillus sp. UNCCL13]